MKNTGKTVLFSGSILLMCFLFSALNSIAVASQKAVENLGAQLDLSYPGLEKVKTAYDKGDFELFGEELLKYYSRRSNVKHPVGRDGSLNLGGGLMSARFRGWADNPEWADLALEHKFIGQKSYPPHFCGKDINWSQSPVQDKEWLWQLHRMYWWESMGLQYQRTKDSKYAAGYVFQLQDWIKKNPNDSDHAFAWRSLEASSRLKSWTYHFQYFFDSGEFDETVLIDFLNSYGEHADYVTQNHRETKNIALINANGLSFAGSFFPEFKNSDKWLEKAAKILNREIRNQVYPDGFHIELSPHYHVGTVDSFSSSYGIAYMNGRHGKFNFVDLLEKMAEATMKTAMPDGRAAQFGDSWKGTEDAKGTLWRFLGRYADLFDRDDFRYLATGGSEGTAPAQTAFALKKSGFYSFRSGWSEDDVCLVMKNGPDGGWHCQPDNGTFEVYAYGKHLMPDSGKYVYSGDEKWRDWFRKTSSHQTVTLNGENSEYAPKFLMFESSGNIDAVLVENQSYENLKHRRGVFFLNNEFFVVLDFAIGSAEGEVACHYNFAPGRVLYDKLELTAKTDYSGDVNLIVKPFAQQGMNLERREGYVSYVYGEKQPREACAYTLEKQSCDDFVFFAAAVVPYKGSSPEVDFNINASSLEPDKGKFQIKYKSDIFEVYYNLEDKIICFN
ncbi:Heparinase II/III-like protein [Limihaloglobus sulfuriphilus]|uniref:Heparinase II/III-like protein n=1 Tax=Limihaloglobus sulfuriphilus TaxID=1851148 RepID=A0A1Q2MFM6_9BACT|nr:alginate lyase family protein [Limihaloglobus sulfuriphilus]AQQ71052.1 Heparinase II/III-like protein [Limihaloglobus sulfuriphilus]